MTSKDTLFARIEQAFPKWDPKSRSFLPKLASTEDFGRLREMVYHIAPPDLPRHVAILLYDLLLNHPPALDKDSSYRTLIFFLDAGYDEEDEREVRSFGTQQLGIPQSEIDEIYEVRHRRQLAFSAFDAEQAQIVFDWLIEASKWECSNSYLMELESAKKFWHRLAQGRSKGSLD